ncbi:hypothetical protein ACWEO2_11240 [Nocardia sp. NPDC004278]
MGSSGLAIGPVGVFVRRAGKPTGIRPTVIATAGRVPIAGFPARAWPRSKERARR